MNDFLQCKVLITFAISMRTSATVKMMCRAFGKEEKVSSSQFFLQLFLALPFSLSLECVHFKDIVVQNMIAICTVCQFEFEIFNPFLFRFLFFLFFLSYLDFFDLAVAFIIRLYTFTTINSTYYSSSTFPRISLFSQSFYFLIMTNSMENNACT